MKSRSLIHLIALCLILLLATTIVTQRLYRGVKMRAQFALAQGLWKKGENEQARVTFQKVVAEYPNTPLARDAERAIHELDSLNLGQPAPLFAYRGINGEPVSLADFKGKVVLLNFWTSW